MDFKAKRIVLSSQQMDQVHVRPDVVYKSIGNLSLKADIYLPPNIPASTQVPAVIFVHGDAPWAILSDAKDWGQYRSWAELTAASGLAAVTFTHRSTERMKHVSDAVSDVVDLITYVRNHAAELSIDADRLGLWVCSAGGPVGLAPVLNGQAGPIRCAAALYALLDIGPERIPEGVSAESVRSFSPAVVLEEAQGLIPPLFVVRAGQDHSDFVKSADRFCAAALARNTDLEFINYPAGHHAFDLQDEEERSCQIIQRVITFFHERLD